MWILQDAEELMKLAFKEENFNAYLQKLSQALTKLTKVVDRASLNWQNITDNQYNILFLDNKNFISEYKQIRVLINQIDKKLDPSLNKSSLWFYSNHYYGVISAHMLILMLNEQTYEKYELQKMLTDLVYILSYKVFIGKFRANLVNQYVNPNIINQAIKSSVRASHKFAQFNSLHDVLMSIATNMTLTFIQNFKSNRNLKRIHNFFSQIQSKFHSYANEIRTYYINYNRNTMVATTDVEQLSVKQDNLKHIIEYFKINPIDQHLTEIALNAINSAVSKDLFIECLKVIKELKNEIILQYLKQLIKYIDVNLDYSANINLLKRNLNKLPIPNEVTQYLLNKKYKLQTVTNVKLALAVYFVGYILHTETESDNLFDESNDIFTEE